MPPDQQPMLDMCLPATELANLSLSRDAGVRRAVAAHPNTSAFILGTLAAEFPAQVLRNPALPLLRLAQPGLVLRWPVIALLALIRQADAPDWLLRQVQAHRSVEVQVALASHPRLPKALADVLSVHPAWLVRARIAARPELPADLLRRLLHDPDDSVRLAVASRPGLGTAERASLGRDPSRFVQQTLRQTRYAAVDT
ncbi:hypothetical protein [Deinococcus sp. KSM4-11]|uniref:hypothetical protein n=1 Tax=Deinococcus sp. KSM4-11 TaxID=2568654 RepID=UPI001454D6B7|nr:hypothetical protein [Deinococcus sp. KSM4-11]